MQRPTHACTSHSSTVSRAARYPIAIRHPVRRGIPRMNGVSREPVHPPQRTRRDGLCVAHDAEKWATRPTSASPPGPCDAYCTLHANGFRMLSPARRMLQIVCHPSMAHVVCCMRSNLATLGASASAQRCWVVTLVECPATCGLMAKLITCSAVRFVYERGPQWKVRYCGPRGCSTL